MTSRVPVEQLRSLVTSIFERLGFSADASGYLAGSLVESDARGVHSHGVMLLPLYAKRVLAGLVRTHDVGEVVVDGVGSAVIDAHLGAGQLMARQAMELAVRKARETGVGAVGVRHSNHFGAAAPYVVAAADAGCVGIAMSTTTPLMPAPGGAEAIVGNNPLAFGAPCPGGDPLVLDMALSAVAGGKIRYAASAGEAIPDSWATDSDGVPTADPEQALAGLLLPFGGHKGFGLALMVDVLAGSLIGAASGDKVRSIYRDFENANDCGHFLIAMDLAHFSGRDVYDRSVASMVERVHSSKRAPGVPELFLPGALEHRAAERSKKAGIELEGAVLSSVLEVAEQFGLPAQLEVG